MSGSNRGILPRGWSAFATRTARLSIFVSYDSKMFLKSFIHDGLSTSTRISGLGCPASIELGVTSTSLFEAGLHSNLIKSLGSTGGSSAKAALVSPCPGVCSRSFLFLYSEDKLFLILRLFSNVSVIGSAKAAKARSLVEVLPLLSSGVGTSIVGGGGFASGPPPSTSVKTSSSDSQCFDCFPLPFFPLFFGKGLGTFGSR